MRFGGLGGCRFPAVRPDRSAVDSGMEVPPFLGVPTKSGHGGMRVHLIQKMNLNRLLLISLYSTMRSYPLDLALYNK